MKKIIRHNTNRRLYTSTWGPYGAEYITVIAESWHKPRHSYKVTQASLNRLKRVKNTPLKALA